MERPITLLIAVILVWITAVTDAVAGIAFVAIGATSSTSELKAAYEAAGIAGQTFGGVFIMVGILFVAMAVLEAVCAVFLGRGASWARVVVTVLLVLSMIGDVTGFFQGGGELILSVVSLVVKVLVLWLMWNARSSAWIREKTASRI